MFNSILSLIFGNSNIKQGVKQNKAAGKCSSCSKQKENETNVSDMEPEYTEAPAKSTTSKTKQKGKSSSNKSGN